MVRLRFHASWLPDDHNRFWTVVECKTTISDLIEYFIEQEKSLADYYQFHLPKRTTKLKYLKAFVNDCVLPPNAQANEILRDNDEVSFRLETDAQNEWLIVKSPPTSKRKRSVEQPETESLDDILRNIAKPKETPASASSSSFQFQFGNKRGRPIPPRPQVISTATVNSLVPRQVLTNKK